MSINLTAKYNVPGPRYTSYPTVPFWESDDLSSLLWEKTVTSSFHASKGSDGISIYIHLPFCENLCTFCGCNRRITKNHSVEIPYIKAVAKEWEMYCSLLNVAPIIKEIHLGGGTPTFFKPENLDLLINNILSKSKLHKDVIMSFEGHPDNTSEEHLKVLSKLGFTRVSFGVQDFDPEVQKVINRVQTFEQVQQITDLSRQTGFTSINFDLVYGLPMQTLESIRYTMNKIRILMPDRIAFYSYAHVPWIKGVGQRKFTDEDLPSAEEKRSFYELGKTLLTEAGYKEIGMDHFAITTDTLYKASVKKSLHRNFMGYSSSSTPIMIGLGVSSISDFWYGFAQNKKNVEEYLASIDQNKLPVFRGHLLNEEDLVLRKHILNIMCSFETDWGPQTMYCEEIDHVIPRLKELELDGLIKLGKDSLIVTDEGRPFVRNICMAFDAKLMRDKPKTQLFSMTV